MNRKLVSGMVLMMLLANMLTLAFNVQPVRASGTIYIRADGSIEGTTDISTVDNVIYAFTASINDSIVVERDNIVVDGAGYTLQGTGSGTGITQVTGRSNVTINNAEITSFLNGIQLYGSYNTVSGNDIKSTVSGIVLHESSNNTISGNNITNNDSGGIVLQASSRNSISGNNITENKIDGIRLSWHSNDNSISGNHLADNGCSIKLDQSGGNSISGNNMANNENGIRVVLGSNYNDISENSLENNEYGISLASSSMYNSISGNNITQNVECGIFLGGSSRNTVSRNNVTDNGDGIHLEYLNEHSNYNSVSGNNITNNEYGIVLRSSSGNTIFYNSLVDNTRQVYVHAVDTYDSANTWDNGYPSGGNYWSNYADIDLYGGLYQNVTGSDGIGDTAYFIDEVNQDNYPLVNPLTEHELVTLVTAPALLQLGSLASLNMTAANRGLSDEGNVELVLFINGTMVESLTIPLLQASDSYTLSYLWTPSAEGTHNVTAYAHPVPGEASIANNQITRFLTVAVPAPPTPPDVRVGVKAGDWIKCDYAVAGWPSGTPYPEWLKVEIMNVEGTTASVRVTMHMSDGTEQSDTVSVDVVAGGETFDTLFGFVIPANCSIGDSIVMGGDGFTFNVTIDGETTRTYADTSRTVVYASFSQHGSELTYYWDKETGIIVEASTVSGGVTGTAKATETNMWEAAPSPFWMQWWFLAIVAVGIIALAGAVYFVKKRKPPTPTATALPIE